MRTVSAVLLLLALAGCGAQKQSPNEAATSQAPDTHGDATAAGGPAEITELTTQTMVFECPKCGMMFDAPGQCSMDQSELVQTQVAYICPADKQAVEQAGKCPRCDQNAIVLKTALNQGAAPAPLTGN